MQEQRIRFVCPGTVGFNAASAIIGSGTDMHSVCDQSSDNSES